MHREIPVKVNAWVDERIAPLVEALNAFPAVETFSSCEGDRHVYFHVRGDAEALFSFIHGLAADLGETVPGCCDFRLHLEWVGSHPSHGALYVAEEALDVVAQGLREISLRRTQCSGDTSRRGAAR